MPTFDHAKTRDILCTAIANTLQKSGRQVPIFHDNDKPVTGYEGFDSQCGVEVTLELEQLLGIDDLGINIFVKGAGSGARARTIAEIVSCLIQFAKGEKP